MNTIYKTLVFLVLLCAGQQAIAQNFITQWNLATAGSGALPLLVLRKVEWAAPPTNMVHVYPLVGEPARYSTHNTNKGVGW